ncbi:Putative vgr related protein [Minicystis rosea]|nr:Putative vgr related protein [Minicystis rosea]
MHVELKIPSLPHSDLSVRRVDIVEGLSMPFEVALLVMSADADLDFTRILGQDASLHLNNGRLGSRSWTGVCSFVEQTDAEPAGLSTYTLRIVPRLWLLSQRTNHRVFQHQTALETVRALLKEHGIEITARVTEENLARHEIRVQYGETDLDFVSRLLEEAGLGYYFDETIEGPGKLVITDAPERAEPRSHSIPFTSEPSPTIAHPFAADVHVALEVKPGAVTIADFDFRRPRFPVVYHSEQAGPGEARLERYTYAPGSGLAELPAAANKANDTPVADDHGYARTSEAQGYALAERRQAALREGRRRVEITTNLVDLSPGTVFSISGAPRPELAHDQRLLVVQTNIDGRVDQAWTVHVVASFATAKVRPPRRVPWPRIEGLQSAIVVGPAGEEIHTDEHGRVRVRFHWDREAALDDRAFAWVRVAEGWAGAGFGMIAIPRVGQEVLVSFYEGNPDQPVIVGRLFDAENPAPTNLPGGKTRFAWRTRSTPRSSGYHELSFDDAAGKELVTLRSERDLEKVVVAAEVDKIEGNTTAAVGRHLDTKITAVDTISAGRMHEVRMAGVTAANTGEIGQPKVTPLDTRREIIAKRITLTTGGATIMLDGPDITVTAQHEVRFVAGGEVNIQGTPYVQINPPKITKAADATKAPAPAEQVVWFRLASDGGQPLAGARVHLEHADGSTSAPHATDGAGQVRIPVDKPGPYQIKIGDPPAKPATPAPKAPAPAPAPKAPAPAPAAKPEAKPAPAPKPETKPAIPVGTTPSQQAAKAKPTDHAVPVAVEIVSPVVPTTLEIDPGTYPGPEPSMPLVTLLAKVLVEGKETSVGSVRWEFSISGKYRVRDHSSKTTGYRWQEFKYAAGTARTKPNQEQKVRLTPAEIVGGDLEIKATFEGGPELGNITAVKVLKGLKVLGKNGPRAQVEQYIVDNAGDLAWLFLRMFCHESEHTLAQFKKGEVRYGPPAGTGIAQQDPEEDEWKWPADRITTPSNFHPRIFWDWRKNVVSGIQHFNSAKLPTGRRLIAKLRKANPNLPQPPEGVIIRAAVRAYNGGREFDASADGKHYVVNPHTTPKNVGYVDWVLGDTHSSLDAKYPVPEDAKARIWPPELPDPRKRP